MSNTSTALTIGGVHGISFLQLESFELAQRVGNMLANSELVPDAYRGKVANCVLALDIAERTGSNVLMVMQNLNMIHGKPSWSSAYIIASIASCGRFTPLRYDVKNLGSINTGGVNLPENLECIAYAWERSVPEAQRTTANRLESAPVSFETAILEGWWTKKGSKWPTMKALMLRYRSATLFGRMYASDVLMGMQSQEEVQDIIDITPVDTAVARLEERMQGTPETDGSTPRRRRGAAAANAAASAATVVVAASMADAAEPAETTTPPAAADAATGVSNPPAPAAEPTPPAAEPPKVNAVKVRTTVKTAVEVPSNGKLYTKAQLEGDEFTGEAFYEWPIIKFAPDGALIEATIERREHKTKPGQWLNVITGYEILA